MLARVRRLLFGLLLLAVGPRIAVAQTLPSPAQAQQMLQNNPSLIGRLQQMLQSSGMTPDQVRARLKAQGYPDSLLNAYLPGGIADSTAIPDDQIFAAVKALGLGDSTVVDSLSVANKRKRRSVAQSDSAFLLDTLQRALKNDTTAAAIRSFLQSRELRRAQTDSGFNVFGYDLFQGQTTQFDANASGSADPNYRFGPGDRLVLFLTGDVEKAYTLPVTRDGFVVIPDVGQLNVAGLTRVQLEDALYGRLGRVYSGVRRGAGATTHFYIDVSQMGQNQVYVNGDVKQPGSYRISRAGTIMNALYLAGGPTTSGSMRAVQVKRNGQTVATLDVYDYALRGDASHDVRLENNDVIFVPSRGPQARVAGAVLRPATYEVSPTQTVSEAIQMAGGFSEGAERRQVRIERIVPPAERTSTGKDRRVVDVPFDLFDTAPVRGGDIIRVTELPNRLSNRVDVKGNVWTPGRVEYRTGMHLSDALKRAGGLKPDSYLGQVLVARLQPDSTRVMLRSALFDTTGRATDDLALTDGDEITVFSVQTFRPRRFVSIAGAVKNPVQIPFREGITLRDAVLLASGLVEGASLTDAEIARLPENRAAGVTAVTQLVPLDSTYLFERGPDGRFIGPPGVAAPVAKAPEVVLHAYDAILIKLQPAWQLQRTVKVQGEVLYPGAYALTTKTERLSDVIARAGGLTTSAYADGVVLVRRRNDVGRIGVDLKSVLRDNRHVDNLTIFDGDSIYIPQYAPVVTVRGAVNSAVGVAYVDGANLDYYIRAAGGATAQGDAGRAFVTQGNGKVESRRRRLGFWGVQPVPQPGSAVFVPLKDPTDRHDWAAIATTATSILGSLVTIVLVTRR